MSTGRLPRANELTMLPTMPSAAETRTICDTENRFISQGMASMTGRMTKPRAAITPCRPRLPTM